MKGENVVKSGAKVRPLGVSILSIFGYIGAALLVLGAVMMFVGSGSIVGAIPGFELLGAELFIVGGVIMLAFGVLEFFIARGLWKGQNWARIVTIIFVGLSILGAITSIVQGEIVSNVIGLAINLWIGWYLLFKANVKAYFA